MGDEKHDRPEAQSLDEKLDAQRDCALEAAALAVDKQASIRRMRGQSFADDSDRADGEAQADDIEREEEIAEALEYAATRIRALKGGTR